MDTYKYFAIISKNKNRIINLVMDSKRPDISLLDNLIEVVEITEKTYCDLAYGDLNIAVGW